MQSRRTQVAPALGVFRAILLYLVVLVGVAGVAPLFAGGSRERSATAGAPGLQCAEGFPVTFVDDGGVPVTLERKPQRILSLTSFTDDILLDLVSLERILGVTVYSQDPEISNVVEKAAAVPHKLLLNVEVILSLRPDLVFVANWTEAAEVAQLRNSGIPVVLLNTGLNVREIERAILSVARLVGEQEKGRAMVARMQERLAAIESRVSTVPPAHRLSVMDYTTWGSAQGRGSSWDEIVRRAGLTNAVGDYNADDWGQVPLSKEKLLSLDPDLLILPGWIYGKPGGARSFFASVVNDPALQTLRAVREGRVYRMPEGLKTAASQYIVDAVEYVARLAYPQLWED